MSKHWKLKETGTSYKFVFASKDNSMQTIFTKFVKTSKVRQELKTSVSLFTYFLSAGTKTFFLLGRNAYTTFRNLEVFHNSFVLFVLNASESLWKYRKCQNIENRR